MTAAAVALPPLASPHAAYGVPPRITTADGRTRKVGVEIEFAGLSVEAASAVVQRLYGGETVPTQRFGAEVRGSSLGEFRVEIDSMPLKTERYKSILEKLGAGDALISVAEDVIETIIRLWVPIEIVTAPIAIEDLGKLEPLRWALFAEHAEGTRASPFYGFGFQLNPELPALDAATITRYLRAFLALHEWLAAVVDVDPTRRLGPYVDAFPEAYRRKVLAPDYAPDEGQLVADYLEDNPTRNRALDMLPVFATLRHDEVIAAAKEGDQIKARPTFHYRLPNCLIDDPAWSFATEWNRWVEVERLAEDPARLAAICDDLLAVPIDAPPISTAAAIARAHRWGVEAP